MFRRGWYAPITVLVLASCVSDGDVGTTTVASVDQDGSAAGDVAPTGVSSPMSVPSVVDGPDRFGDGRALTARYSAAADRLVVVTAVGFAVMDSGDEPRMVERPMTGDEAVALSPDGELVAIVDQAGTTLEIRDLSDGARGVGVNLPGDPVQLVAFAGDGSSVFVGTGQGVERWSLDGSVEAVVEPSSEGSRFGAGQISTDGDLVTAVQSSESASTLSAWRPATGARELMLDVDSDDRVGRLSSSNDGALIAIEVLDPLDPTADEILVVEGAAGSASQRRLQMSGVAGTFWTVAGEHVVVADTSSITWYDVDGTEVARQSLADLSPVVQISYAAGGPTLTVHDDGEVVVWDPVGHRSGSLPATNGPIDEFVRADGANVVAISRSGRVERWDVEVLALTAATDAFAGGAVNDVAVSSDGRHLAAAYRSGAVRSFDLLTGDVDFLVEPDGRNVDAVAYSPDSARITTGIGERLSVDAFDDTVTVREVSNEAVVAEFGGEGESVSGCSQFRNLVRYSPNGELLAVNSHDFTVGLYRSDDLAPVATLPPHGGTVLDLAFSPDGSLLATTSEDWTLHLWDVESLRPIADYEAPVGGYWSLAFSPDGTALATIGVTGMVELIDIETGAALTTFTEAANWSSDIDFSPDGTLLAAGGQFGEVLIWRSDGTVVDRLVGHGGPVDAVEFSPDGSFVVSGSADGTVRRWLLTT